VLKDLYPVQWTGEQAVVTLPEHIDVSNAGDHRHFTLTGIRDTITARQRDDLIHLAQATAAEEAHNGRKLRDSVLSNLLKVGLSLEAAIDLSDGVATQHITEALSRLDDAIHEIQYDVFGGRTGQPPTHPPPDGSQ
jgi:hypothetical protein